MFQLNDLREFRYINKISKLDWDKILPSNFRIYASEATAHILTPSY